MLPLFVGGKHMESLLTALSALVWLIFGIIALVAGAIVAVFAFAYTWVLISYIKEKIKDHVQN